MFMLANVCECPQNKSNQIKSFAHQPQLRLVLALRLQIQVVLLYYFALCKKKTS